jgi:RNA 2',3'-cyclic 3'-phosphodiesterase
VPENSKSWRLFIAIELPAYVRQKIRQHVDTLRRELPDARASWTREDNLHLTLKFFGDTPVERVESVSTALRFAANHVSPFEMELSGCGAFHTRGKPNVLWIGINDPSNNLHKLYESLENECARVGFDRDQRPFHPHLTIARIRHPEHARELAELHRSTSCNSQMIEVSDVCLVRSELSSQGSRYTILSRHELTQLRD